MRPLKITAVTVLAVGLLAGCASASDAGEGGSTSIVLGSVAAPTTFEAADFSWGHQSLYAQAVYDTLLKANADGVTIEPSLATEWSWDETETILTLTLRDDVVFTDGTPFTAAVAAENLLRFRDGESPERVKAAYLADAQATDDTTLTITLTSPDRAFLASLTQAMGLQESPEAFENADVKTNPVGSGPYVLDVASSVVGSSYNFTRNEDYWDSESYPYDDLTVRVFTDGTSIVNAVRGDQVDGAHILANIYAPEIEQAGFDLHPNALSLAGVIIFDREGALVPALGDVRVRQAMSLAIDKPAFLEASLVGFGELDQQVFRNTSEAWDESLNETYPYDPEEARRLLAEAGYEDGFDLEMPTTLGVPTSLTNLIATQLGEVGIRATFTDVGANWGSDILSQKFAASYFELVQFTNEYMLIDSMIAPESTWNPFRNETPELNALIDTARTGDDAEATEALAGINEFLVDNAWFGKWYTAQLIFTTNSETDATPNKSNQYPNLWDIVPAE